MYDSSLFVSLRVIRKQLTAMPHDLYLIRLIHHATYRAFPGERLWTAAQLLQEPTIRFLRIRNREGCDIYLQPYAGNLNAGYILLDLDVGDAHALERMHANGHEPCVVLQTSPGHLQAWVRVSATPLLPAIATAVGKHLARSYGGDLASADWRHLGRLAGFTNQKPLRRLGNGYAPWVRLMYSRPGLATQSTTLLEAAHHSVTAAPAAFAATPPRTQHAGDLLPATDHLSDSRQIYQTWVSRLHIPQRFPQPDWSIADKWIATELLRLGTPMVAVAALLRQGSPGFPRRHANPEDYLQRTLARALSELSFPAPAPRALCVHRRPSQDSRLTDPCRTHAWPPSDPDAGGSSA